MPKRAPFQIGGASIAPGSRQTVDLPVSTLSDHTPVTMSVHVVHGKTDGPTLCVSAGIHGDEVIGIEIVRRLLRAPNLKSLRGTLLVVPIVNTFGFLNRSRYLPDRRDLNRCFPGSEQGSMASRLAHLFLTEVVCRSDVGIDLHSAAIQRTNLPQIRISPGNEHLRKMANVFGAPVVLTSKLRDGSLRMCAQEAGVEMLLYEAGEGLRFDEFAARAGMSGILRVMRELGMISSRGVEKPKMPAMMCKKSIWLRAPAGGLMRSFKSAGEIVAEGDVLGVVSDPFGQVETEMLADLAGIIVGRSNLPIVNEGDALFHIAELPDPEESGETLEGLTAQLDGDPMFDEDEII